MGSLSQARPFGTWTCAHRRVLVGLGVYPPIFIVHPSKLVQDGFGPFAGTMNCLGDPIVCAHSLRSIRRCIAMAQDGPYQMATDGPRAAFSMSQEPQVSYIQYGCFPILKIGSPESVLVSLWLSLKDPQEGYPEKMMPTDSTES